MISTIIILLIVNLLIGLGPLFVKFLPDISPFTIVFFRFFIALLIEIIVIIILWISLWKKLKKHQFQIKFREMLSQSLKNYYLGKNRQFLNGSAQLFYTAWLGFLQIALVVPFYYLSFTFLGVIPSTIISCSIPIIIIAMISWVQKKEEMDSFKVIYLFLLVAGVFTIAFSKQNESSTSISFLGIIVLAISTLAYIGYLISVGRDSQLRVKLFDNITIFSHTASNEIVPTLTMVRSFYKLIAIHFFGILSMVILAIILYWISPTGEIGKTAGQFFITDVHLFARLFINPFVILNSIVCTMIPFVLQIVASINWPRFKLSFESWNSILIVIQPLVGLYIGLLVWKEDISFDYIIFTTIFLVISIVIRYLHENSNFMLVLFTVRIKNANINELIKYLTAIKEIEEINLSLGKIGLLIHASVRSLPRLFSIQQMIELLPGVIKVNYIPEIPIKSDS